MIPVAEAQALCLDPLTPLPPETIPLRHAAGRMLATPVTAARAQPPFPASAMDGYAVPVAAPRPGDRFEVIGESAAGHAWLGMLRPGQAVRIFTGAPVPEGAHHVVIQEDVDCDGDTITLKPSLGRGPNIRAAGADFGADYTLDMPRLLTPTDLALLAAMNAGTVAVSRKPVVALMATGDELVMPNETPRADQITVSNIFALVAMVENAGGIARILPIARDTEASLSTAFGLATDADIVVTVGGASVGDHDLVRPMAEAAGFVMDFHRIAMRPGKPLMLGRRDAQAFLGLPGNPVSAIVCGHLFLLPMVRKLLGDPAPLPPVRQAELTVALPANGPRAHYMRAVLSDGLVTPFDRQDSALLHVLSQANALMIRPPDDGERRPGDRLDTMAL